jgi:hypothetical protein
VRCGVLPGVFLIFGNLADEMDFNWLQKDSIQLSCNRADIDADQSHMLIYLGILSEKDLAYAWINGLERCTGNAVYAVEWNLERASDCAVRALARDHE